MAKNKKLKKNVNKVLVGQAVKTLPHSVLKTNYNSSKSSKQLLSVSGHKKTSSPIDDSLGDAVANDDRLETDDIDHSLTREPINLGVKNVRQILTCVKEATLEVKDLILNECNIIYECKICTNLFRSLANFIAHKRIYCKRHFCEQMVLFDSTHIQFNEEDDNENELEDEDIANDSNEVTEGQAVQTQEPSTSSVPEMVSPVSSSNNSLNENINPNDSQSDASKKRKFIDDCIQKTEDEKIKQEETDQVEMQLTKIKGNSNAVYQNVLTPGSEDHSDQNESNKEVNKKKFILDLFKEAKSGLTESQAVKRQRIEDILPPIDANSESNDNKDNQLKCDVCESSFTSSKTLNVHMKTIHSSNRTVYPCPLCSLTFKHLSNATRHLIQIHKRTKTQANGLKEILKRRAYSDLTNSSENSSEVEDNSDEDNERKACLQTNSRRHSENKIKSNNRSLLTTSEKPNDKQSTRTIYTCVYNCGNTFDWPPAKKSHEKSCRRRHDQTDQHEDSPVPQTNGSHLTILSRDQRNNTSQKNSESEYNCNQELPTVPTNNSNHMSTNLVLPKSVEEKVKEFADLKSMRCKHCPSQDFMNLNQLLQHAVTHIGHSIYKCHGCSYHSIYDNDMKAHLMNSHNINEDMISKHYQTLPNLTQPRLLILPIKSSKADTSDPGSAQSESPQSPDKKDSKLKIHLRTMGNTSKKCYEIVDK